MRCEREFVLRLLEALRIYAYYLTQDQKYTEYT